MANIAIIGAGVAGLAAAWDLVKHGHRVAIYEAQAEVGGLAAGFKDPRWAWSLEKFYHHWFQSDRDLLGLAEELGVRQKIFFPRPKTSIWHPDGVFQLDGAVSALRLPILDPISKVRFGLVMLYLRLTRQWQYLERHTADAWLQRSMGRKVYELLWKPLLIGKFGTFYDQANMAWMWARVYSRTTRLGTYEGGFQQFAEDLAAALRARGVQIYLNTPVQAIERQAEGLLLSIDGQPQSFDAVLSTTSPRLVLKLAPQLEGTYAQKVAALQSIGAVVLVLALDRQLMTDGTYWLNLPANSPDRTQNPFPYLALVEHTNFLERAHYGGDHLVYLGDYVPPEHEYFQMSEAELLDRFLPALTRVNPSFTRTWVRQHWLFRAPYAQPLPTRNHSQNLPDLRTPLAGLYWASMSQVYPWDRGTNYAVEIGRRVARLIMEDMGTAHTKTTE
ncbi:MAG: NAD(P)/FAD-dependent oxidoreductase [Anaerolineae bacterium]|nr:NAD(P)/FAD-dependent oxidoreductase [Anaerolineae bacterium]